DTFIDLHTVNFNPAASGGAGQPLVNTLVALSSDSGPLADNVARLRFGFNATENGYAGYREIDVLGAAVPEPGAMAALAPVVLLLRRRARSGWIHPRAGTCPSRG